MTIVFAAEGMLTQGVKELHIISLNITALELFMANLMLIAILVALAIGIYDKWFAGRKRD